MHRCSIIYKQSSNAVNKSPQETSATIRRHIAPQRCVYPWEESTQTWILGSLCISSRAGYFFRFGVENIFRQKLENFSKYFDFSKWDAKSRKPDFHDFLTPFGKNFSPFRGVEKFFRNISKKFFEKIFPWKNFRALVGGGPEPWWVSPGPAHIWARAHMG